MEKNQGISIEQVANGFEVRPHFPPGCLVSSIHVFNSMADLILWLSGHFDHRSVKLNEDRK